MSTPTSSSQSLIFTERVTRPNNHGRRLTFTNLLVILYIYGGLSAFLFLVSKTILNPLFQQLTYDRRVYHAKAIDLLRDLNDRLQKKVSTIPRVTPTAKYADAQTQTSLTDPVRYTTTAVGFEDEMSQVDAVRARTKKLCSRLEVLTTGIKDLTDKSQFEQVGTMKYAITELKSMTDTLNSGIDMDRRPGVKSRAEMVSEVKREIRSFKGSFLSARKFPGVNR